MTCGVNGLVFKRDPINSSGDFTVTASQPNSVLDDHDFDELLPDLDPPSGGTQSRLKRRSSTKCTPCSTREKISRIRCGI
jgi:hypothetical protein